MRPIEDVVADMNKRYDAYNDIHKMLTMAGFEMISEWDGTKTIGGKFRKDWQIVQVDTYWEADEIRLIINKETIVEILWDHQWESHVSDILETLG